MGEIRRTLAIVFSDLKGFSALMAADEPAALAVVDEHNALLRRVTADHGGRVVKFLGDGALWCFDNAADAVRAALAVQAELASRNVGASHPILLRIGIHVGDVVVRDDDVFGDGVNLAARLEPLASPGGVVVSRAVQEMVRAQPGLAFTALGAKVLKNIPEPMEVFAVGSGTPPPAPAPPQRHRGRLLLLAGLAVAAGGLALLALPSLRGSPAPSGSLAAALADRPGPLRVGLRPTEAVGVGPEVARALDLRLRGALDRTAGIELVDLAPRGGARVVLVPAVGALGNRHLLNLERVDPATGRVLSRAYRESDSLDGVLSTVDDALYDAIATESAGAAKAAIDDAVHRSVGELGSCYGAALERRPDLTGHLVLAWAIAPSGHTTDARVEEDTVGDAELGACLAGRVDRWLFPATLAGVERVSWPFSFEPR